MEFMESPPPVSLPNDHASTPTTRMVTSELTARTVADGGGGAMVIPIAVKASRTTARTASDSLFTRDTDQRRE